MYVCMYVCMYIYVLQGLINDPDLDGTHNIKKGIRLARYTQVCVFHVITIITIIIIIVSHNIKGAFGSPMCVCIYMHTFSKVLS
jgi:hypothetical protein